MNRCRIALTLIAVSLCCSADAAVLRGFVVDAASREPLPVAAVIVEGTDRGASTNLDGFFVIDYLEPGEYRLQVSYLGYRPITITANALEKPLAPLTIKLVSESMALEKVVISVTQNEGRVDRRAPTVSSVPVEAALIRSIPSLGAEMDVLRALQTIPGVKASSDISSALYVRGGSPDQTLILMDHNVVYNPSHLFGIFSTFNADAVKRVALLKGGFPVEFGGRSGSVLEVITNEGNRVKSEGLVSLGIVSARGAIEGPLPAERGSYALSARRTYLDPVIDAMRKAQDIDLPDYYFYDANGKVNLDLTDRTTLTIAGYSGDDRLEFVGGPKDSRFRMLLQWGNRTISTRFRHALGRSLFFSVNAAASRYLSEWSFSNDDVLLDRGRDEMLDQTIRSDFEVLGGVAHKVKLGIQLTNYNIGFKEENEDLVWVSVDGDVNNWSAYIQDNWRVNPFIELQAGLRGYYHVLGRRSAVDPRLSMVYHYDNTLRFKAAVGKFSQFINLMTVGEGFTNFDLWIPIDHSMKPSYSIQYITGVEWDFQAGYEGTFEVYYTAMHNLADFNPEVDRGNKARDAFVVGEGEAYGLEWMLRKEHGNLTGWFGYSLSWSRRRFPASLVNFGNWFYPKWDRRHDFIAVASYHLSRAWEIAGAWRYNTGQGFTQALGVYTSRIGGIGSDEFGDYGRTILYGAKNNYRFPSDHRLDISANYHHLMLGNPAKLSFSIFNVYSRRSYWQRSFDTSKNPVEIADIKLLPILPLISYELRF